MHLYFFFDASPIGFSRAPTLPGLLVQLGYTLGSPKTAQLVLRLPVHVWFEMGADVDTDVAAIHGALQPTKPHWHSCEPRTPSKSYSKKEFNSKPTRSLSYPSGNPNPPIPTHQVDQAIASFVKTPHGAPHGPPTQVARRLLRAPRKAPSAAKGWPRPKGFLRGRPPAAGQGRRAQR